MEKTLSYITGRNHIDNHVENNILVEAIKVLIEGIII